MIRHVNQQKKKKNSKKKNQSQKKYKISRNNTGDTIRKF